MLVCDGQRGRIGYGCSLVRVPYHSRLSLQDCTSLDEHGIAAALLPLVTAFCRVSVGL